MMLKRLWLWSFPLLFLPNLGVGIATAQGGLELSDFLIWSYLGLLVVATPVRRGLNVSRITPLLGMFVLWATASTLTIPLRYPYISNPLEVYGPFGLGNEQVTFGLLKIAKLCLYGVAGILTARALKDAEARAAFDWSLLGGGVVTGLSLFVLGSGERTNEASQGLTYSATNGTSAMVAILLVYLSARYLTGSGSRHWRQTAPFGFVIMAAGFALSNGRGGWIAALAGLCYIAVRLGFRRQLVVYGTLALVVVAALYQTQPDFKDQVDMTVFAPASTSGYQGTRNVGSLDDGGRFENWSHESRQFVHEPLLGTGFYHRGGLSGLWSTGSHNFFLQMFLETGVIGGTLVFAVVVSMWRQAGRLAAAEPYEDLALKAALVAAIVAGFGGEYFYGGVILFALFAVYAPTGSTARPASRTKDMVEHPGGWLAPPSPPPSAIARSRNV